ncbi:50S ribosomal protein L3 [Spectribacter hydrogenoxidans]|uniref:Large ribosomal subunit protein uL3 n=1 Tax=Spectribacter hydrogenoxidans TaxID=3075608 RepID=A0ABU3C3K8_9GAMM|nr:50S ribosomal protein L3 [Salinisphaera sp. W335]MDT0636143.1 50S ribosomal protein L3 [Salinisphaera sp. W335]
MAIGLVGRKRGMTRVFTDAGASVPVTVVEVTPNRVTQIKTADTDGYTAVQVTTGERRASRVNRPSAGHFKKAGVDAGRGLWEFRLAEGENMPKLKRPMAAAELAEGEEADAEPAFEEIDIEVGAEITASLFEDGQVVDVVGRSIGKGYAGVIKRHNFRAQRATHGNSKAHRAPGSIGQNQTPGHVFKGKKMAGHMGDARTTVQNLEIFRVDAARNLLLIRGGIPGAKGGDVVIRPAVKG